MDPPSTHIARHSAAALHFCHVLVQSHMQMHKSFIFDIALTKSLDKPFCSLGNIPWIENTKDFLMPFYQHKQKRQLIIFSKAEERQVNDHVTALNDSVGLFTCMFLLGRGLRMATLSQLLLTGLNTLSTYLLGVSTSLNSVRWKQKWQDGECHPLNFSLVFTLRQILLWASQAFFVLQESFGLELFGNIQWQISLEKRIVTIIEFSSSENMKRVQWLSIQSSSYKRQLVTKKALDVVLSLHFLLPVLLKC